MPRPKSWTVEELRDVVVVFRRKVERPPFEQLLFEVREDGFLATGRKYGVSDNAIRKWIRQYERERQAPASRPDDGLSQFA